MDTLFLYGVALAFFLASAIKDKKKTKQALMKGLKSLEGIVPQLIVVLLCIAIALALFDADTISRYLGPASGVWGVLISALIGSITLIPGFVAFPAASELLHNGAGVLQIATFVSTLMMVGIITLPLEMSYFGTKIAIIRNVLALLFSFVAAVFVASVVAL